jgi:broad specificity phosphatase PhoE
MHTNSIALQYVMHMENADPHGADNLIGVELNDLYQQFCSWRLKQNDLSVWEDMAVKRLFNDIVDWKRTTKRDPSGVGYKGVYTITGFKRDALAFLDNWRTPDNIEEVVSDAATVRVVEG